MYQRIHFLTYPPILKGKYHHWIMLSSLFLLQVIRLDGRQFSIQTFLSSRTCLETVQNTKKLSSLLKRYH